MAKVTTPERMLVEMEELRARLADAEELLQAIREGEVDALVVSGPQGRVITELQGAEYAYRAMVEQMSEGAATMDENGFILFVNPALSKLLQLSPSDLLGRPFRDFILTKDIPLYDTLLRSGLFTQVKGEVSLVACDGSKAPVYLSINPLDVDGKIFISLVITDLSEQKKTEELLQAIAEREKAEQVMAEAARKAEAANKSKSEFLANMSHEIRTPLNGILGALQLLKISSLDTQQSLLVQMSYDSGRRLTRLLTDILDLSRVEANQLAIMNAPLNLEEVFQSVEQMFQPVAQRAGVSLNYGLDIALPKKLLGDAVRLQQVISNLVGNALKFTEQGEVSFEAYALSSLQPNKARVLFVIKDTGIGIDDAKLDDLFKPFTQGEGGYQRKYQGAGLGLAICKKIISLMGGGLAVDTESGVGTTFYFVLSFDCEPLEFALQASEEGRQTVKSLRILVAEDDEVSALTIKFALEKTGHAVTVVKNGRECLNHLSANEYALILMDVQMPVVDGVEATKIIRSSPEFASKAAIPIIAMTAYAMSGDREKFLEVGMNEYLSKPLQFEELHQAISKVRKAPLLHEKKS